MGTESYGEKISKELQVRFELTNEAMDQISRDIDRAIAGGLQLDAYLRLPLRLRKRQDNEIDPKHYNKRKGLEPYYEPYTPENPRPYKLKNQHWKTAAQQARYKERQEKLNKKYITKEQETASEVIELAGLRNDMQEIMKHHYEGRIISNETKVKMNRIKELEAKFKD